jgi:hypothetical protein
MLRPPNGRRPPRPESVNAEPGSGWALVGNYRHLPDGYEAASLVIADCDCMADCAPGRSRRTITSGCWREPQLLLRHAEVLEAFAPTLWCVGSTLALEELPRDRSILRTIARGHQGCLGVYGSVASTGLVRVGDPVVLTAS